VRGRRARLVSVRTSRTRKTLTVLGTVLGVAYLLAGVTIGLWPDYWDEASVAEQALFVGFSIGGGALLLVGLRRFERSPWVAAALVSIGALAGALPFYWSLAVPLAAFVLVVLGFVHARRLATAP